MRTSPLLLFCFAVAACTPGSPVTVVKIATGEQIEGAKGDTVKFRRGPQESFSGARDGYFVVRTHEDWANLHMTTQPPPFPPTLDPARSMLVVVVGDEKEVAETRIQRMVESANALHVWVRATKRGEGCVAKSERPVDSAVTVRIDKPLRFYVEESHGDSCGEAPTATIQCRLEGAQQWAPKLEAKPGDTVECELAAEAKGKFAIVDRVLSLGELPLGSSAKIAYSRGAMRGAFAVDVFGRYALRGEVTDDGGRRTVVTVPIDALPPKSKDAIVQLAWQNFDVSDDPETFPRTKLRATDPKGKECSASSPLPAMCKIKTKSAYTHLELPASDAKVGLSVTYVDERIEKGPLACIQVYWDGTRTVETCDRKHRAADEKWEIGVLDMTTGKLVEK
jgi:hypothetical protein